MRALWESPTWPIITCKECGKREQTGLPAENHASKQEGGRYGQGLAERMRDESVCFSCLFWVRYMDEMASEPGRHFVALHNETEPRAYSFGREDAPGRKEGRGFAGANVLIHFPDAKPGEGYVFSSNLWDRGNVPEHFRDRLPATARFVRKPWVALDNQGDYLGHASDVISPRARTWPFPAEGVKR